MSGHTPGPTDMERAERIVDQLSGLDLPALIIVRDRVVEHMDRFDPCAFVDEGYDEDDPHAKPVMAAELERAKADIAELVEVLNEAWAWLQSAYDEYDEVGDPNRKPAYIYHAVRPVKQRIDAALAKHARAETPDKADKQAKALRAAGVPIEDEPHAD